MKKDPGTKVRLELDAELIADLDADGDDVKGGQSGGGASYTSGSGTVSGSGSVVSRRAGPAVQADPGGGLNAC